MPSKLVDCVSLIDDWGFDKLAVFLDQLSPETKSRFGPHGYDISAIRHFYRDARNLGFYFKNFDDSMVGYAILRHGFLEHDRLRLEGYGLQLSHETDGTFAPAVADLWQGKGIGQALFERVRREAGEKGIDRIVLWGGVQANNIFAVRYYAKLGFEVLGEFEYFGRNLDVCCNLKTP